MALLDVDRVSKSFGSLRAVDDVSFSVEPGTIVGIAGPNGSGKSTLFNLITGIPFGPDQGAVRLDGIDVAGLSAAAIARRGLARTFQRETSFDDLTVLENATIGASFGKEQRGSSSDVRKRAVEALQAVGFATARFGRRAAELSVYERKCLMLASALAMDPRVLLMDEPASGLTRPEIDACVELIRGIAARGVTIVLIEHVLTFLMSLSQHLIVLNQGTVLASGEPRAVIADDRVVEAYLGRRRAAA